MKDLSKTYTNGEVTIVWKPSACIHSANCWKKAGSLPEVFNPAEKPWIKPENASTKRIIDQIKKCPSGALSYYMNDENKNEVVEVKEERNIEVIPNGPLMVYGTLKIKTATGEEIKENKVTAFCRCGASSNKPYCDGSHRKIDFTG